MSYQSPHHKGQGWWRSLFHPFPFCIRDVLLVLHGLLSFKRQMIHLNAKKPRMSLMKTPVYYAIGYANSCWRKSVNPGCPSSQLLMVQGFVFCSATAAVLGKFSNSCLETGDKTKSFKGDSLDAFTICEALPNCCRTDHKELGNLNLSGTTQKGAAKSLIFKKNCSLPILTNVHIFPQVGSQSWIFFGRIWGVSSCSLLKQLELSKSQRHREPQPSVFNILILMGL